MSGLTKAQERELTRIRDYKPSDEWPYASFWPDSRTDALLLKRGLIKRADMHKTLRSGRSATWFGCVITDAGRAALAEHPHDPR